MKITQELLRECFTYHNGELSYIGYAKYTNKPIRTLQKHHSGYATIYLFNKHHQLHRLIWIMHNGDIPSGMTIDHINRVRDDNRIENLRLATSLMQARNRSHCFKIGNIYIVNDGRKAKYRGAITHAGIKYNIKGKKTLQEAEQSILELHNDMLINIEGYADGFI